MATRVFVGRLNYVVRERDLEHFFRGYGRVGDVVLKNGFGFVKIADYRDAEDAVRDLNGKRLMGRRVTVELARGMRRWTTDYDSGSRRCGRPTRTDYQLLVENLSSSVGPHDLKDFMRQAGEVTYTEAHSMRRHEGVVEFASYSDMKKALRSLDNVNLRGRRIRLVETKRLQRPSSRSRSRSRSPRRSRSNSRQRQSSGRRRSSSGSERASARRRSRYSPRRPSSSRSRSDSRSRRRTNNNRRSRSKTPRSPAKRASSRSSSGERRVSPHQNRSGTEEPAHQADCKAQEDIIGSGEEAISLRSPSRPTE
nr:serine/arginine-rich splicing factor 5-like [Rhipicephalus microplus]